MKFKRYTRNGFEIDIPEHFRVKSHIPDFYAVTRRRKTSVIIKVIVDPIVQKALEDFIRQPLGPSIPPMKSRLIETSLPRLGYDVAHQVTETEVHGKYTSLWTLNIHLGESLIYVQLSALSDFASNEAHWRHILESMVFPSMMPTQTTDRVEEEQDRAAMTVFQPNELSSYSYTLKKRKGSIKSFLIVPCPEQDGVRLFHLTERAKTQLPISAARHPNHLAAMHEVKAEFGGDETDWKEQDGPPDWIGVFEDSARKAIDSYIEGTKE